jgi:hypothetical protein
MYTHNKSTAFPMPICNELAALCTELHTDWTINVDSRVYSHLHAWRECGCGCTACGRLLYQLDKVGGGGVLCAGTVPLQHLLHRLWAVWPVLTGIT